MLVLSRRVRERIRIGPDISIEVLEIRDGRVKLGIDAPRDVSVQRQEVFDLQQQAAPEQD
jgi:carbon storage regulator